MSSISIILIFVIFSVSIWYVIQPFFSEDAGSDIADDENMDALLLKKNVILEQIKELEMDHEIGNIDDSDFQATRDELKGKAAEVLNLIKKAGK